MGVKTRRGLGSRVSVSAPAARAPHITRVVVLYNTDVAWSLTTSQYWAAARNLTVEYVGFSFGTDVIDSSNITGNAYAISSDAERATFWSGLMTDISDAAERINAQGVFMAAATPFELNYWLGDGTNRKVNFPSNLNRVRGAVKTIAKYGFPYPPDGVSTLTGGASRGWSITYSASFAEGSGNPGPEYNWTNLKGEQYMSHDSYQNMRFAGTPLLPDDQLTNAPVRKWGVSTFEQASFSDTEGLDVYLAGKLTFFSDSQNDYLSEEVVVGRIGKPLYTTQAVNTFLGDETEAETLSIINDALESEGSISTHRDKPIWVGVGTLAYKPTVIVNHAIETVATYDMLRKAGFRNVKYFTSGKIAAAEQAAVDKYCPESGREFTYNDLTGPAMDLDCFMLVGYAFRNADPQDAVTEDVPGTGVTGQDTTNAFKYAKGSVANMGTSASYRHPVRCQERVSGRQVGGVGGIGSVWEPTAGLNRIGHFLWAQALVQGFSLAEAAYMTDLRSGHTSATVGDPLYAPFRHQEWSEYWTPEGQEPVPVMV